MAYGGARLALQLLLASFRHRPTPQNLAQRLEALPCHGLPLHDRVEIYWDRHLVPFIEAQSDRDLAVTLGLVHAHLRLAQMELLRRIAQGRLAEMLGPVAIGIDHVFRLLDPGRAVAAVLGDLPEETRDWLEGFVAGINHHLCSTAEPPLEFRLLGISAEPWTIEHIVQIGRLVAADVNWIVWLRLLRLPRSSDWLQGWTRLQREGGLNFSPAADDEAAAGLLSQFTRSGSNAVAVNGSRSATGCAWLAGDPHLALTVPGTWLAAAYRSPSYNVAGLMIPGIPVMAIGRNRWIAWGGTNLHAASSELFDVSGLAASAITERRVPLKVRWSGARELVLRETEYGPIISDARVLRTDRMIALRWAGHDPSDEISALLSLNRARDWACFRRAAAGLAVPGQTLVYADHAGHIGRVLAAWLPRRPVIPPQDFISPPAAASAWASRVGSDELSAEFDPAGGFVVSANDRPTPQSVLVGWFFAPPERAARLAELVGTAGTIGFADLVRLQQDVMAQSALVLRDRCIAASDPCPSPLIAAFSRWDGRYETASAGALAFELVLSRLAHAIIPPPRRAVYDAIWTTRELIAQEIAALPPERLTDHVRRAFRQAEPAFAHWRSWGAVHRLRLRHPLALLPGLRRRFRFGEWPWPGSSDTVMKAAHGLVEGLHTVSYGSNARYIFDLSDPDANHVVLLGGQDGIPGSAALLDQVELFRRGETIQVPLRPETARTMSVQRTRLDPRL